MASTLELERPEALHTALMMFWREGYLAGLRRVLAPSAKLSQDAALAG
jgi:hypothetical protein